MAEDMFVVDLAEDEVFPNIKRSQSNLPCVWSSDNLDSSLITAGVLVGFLVEQLGTAKVYANTADRFSTTPLLPDTNVLADVLKLVSGQDTEVDPVNILNMSSLIIAANHSEVSFSTLRPFFTNPSVFEL